MDLFFARHGQSMSNAGLVDIDDTELTENGQMQTALLGERLSTRKFDCIIASPLIRTLQTAWNIASRQPGGPAPVEVCGALMEVATEAGYPGCPEGMIKKYLPTAIPAKGAEGLPKVLEDETDREVSFARAQKVLTYLLDRFSGDECVCIVGHGNIFSCILNYCLGTDRSGCDLKLTHVNAAISRMQIKRDENGKISCHVRCIDDSRHVPYELLSPCGKSDLY